MTKIDDDSKKRGNLGFFGTLIVLAGGGIGASFGWDAGTASLYRYAMKGAARLGADQRGPVLLGYSLIGFIGGMIVAYIGVRLWLRFWGANK